jgi:hypothetical protein
LRNHADVLSWDPDSDPGRYASGYGHTFLELFVRLRAAGDPVTIGDRIPAGAGTVVVSLEELSEWNRHGLPHMTLALARRLIVRLRGVVVIRNDLHPHIASPQCTTREFMPTRALVSDPARQHVVPLLPQRGIQPRSRERPDRVATVVLKAYRENVPAWIDDLVLALGRQGVLVRVDDQNDHDSHGWADFTDVDVALCTQHQETLGDSRRKPATKLINAWSAGVIPICESRVAYLELANEGIDSIIASDVSEIAAAIARLNDNPTVTRTFLGESERRGHEFSVDSVTELWRIALSNVPRTTRIRVALDVSLAVIQIALGPRVSAAIRRRLPSHGSLN